MEQHPMPRTKSVLGQETLPKSSLAGGLSTSGRPTLRISVPRLLPMRVLEGQSLFYNAKYTEGKDLGD